MKKNKIWFYWTVCDQTLLPKRSLVLNSGRLRHNKWKKEGEAAEAFCAAAGEAERKRQ